MSTLNILKSKKLDHYNTPLYIWKMLMEFLEFNKETIIYEPFWNDGKSKTYFQKLGFHNIIHENEDFFTSYHKYNFDIIISNPPYSIKKHILKTLYQINKPFILIVPSTIISKQYIKNIFKDDIDKLQYIIPSRRMHFEFIDGTINKRCPFDTIFLCFKLFLKRDLIYM